jgi:predicted Fe-S protein YdhL (DUF1289 family)
MTSLTLQIRCVGCDRLLAEVLDVIDAGYATIELRCAGCGRARLELVGSLGCSEARHGDAGGRGLADLDA